MRGVVAKARRGGTRSREQRAGAGAGVGPAPPPPTRGSVLSSLLRRSLAQKAGLTEGASVPLSRGEEQA